MESLLNNLPLILGLIGLAGILGYWYKSSEYRRDLSFILDNLLLLFRNFWDWNLSKIIVICYSAITGFVLSSPLLGILIFLFYKASTVLNPESVSEFLREGASENLISSMTSHIGLFFGIAFLIVLIIAIFSFTFMYGSFLMQKTYRSYLSRKRLLLSKFAIVSGIAYFLLYLIYQRLFDIFPGNSFNAVIAVLVLGLLVIPFMLFGTLKSENAFFDYQLIWSYVKLSAWTALILLIPIIVWFLVMITLSLLALIPSFQAFMNPEVEVQTAGQQIFWLCTSAFTIICLLSTFYLTIRVSFAFGSLLYSQDPSDTAKSHVKQGLAITRGRFPYMVALGFPFLLLSVLLSGALEIIAMYWESLGIILDIAYFLTIFGMGSMIFVSIYVILEKMPQAETGRYRFGIWERMFSWFGLSSRGIDDLPEDFTREQTSARFKKPSEPQEFIQTAEEKLVSTGMSNEKPILRKKKVTAGGDEGEKRKSRQTEVSTETPRRRGRPKKA